MNFLEKYLNSDSPSGFENESQQIWLDYMKQFSDDIIIDDYGTVVCTIDSKNKNDYTVLIEAHVDEISFVVNYISDNGMIYVKKNGGADHQIAPSKKIIIHTKNGIVEGVFGWPAVHVRGGVTKETQPTLEKLFIDCGMDKKGLEEKGVKVGCLVTYPETYQKIGNYHTCKSLDNKIGGYIISQVAKRIRERGDDLNYRLYIVNSVQEEVGLKGARMIMQKIKPNVAIVTDVTHDTSTPHMNKIKNGDVKCGKGPVIAISPTVQQKLRELIEDVSEKDNIKIQRKANGSSTGTDTESFQSFGVPSALISIPLRYMHTTVEMVHEDDVEKTIDLIYSTLKNIKYNHNFKFIK